MDKRPSKRLKTGVPPTPEPSLPSTSKFNQQAPRFFKTLQTEKQRRESLEKSTKSSKASRPRPFQTPVLSSTNTYSKESTSRDNKKQSFTPQYRRQQSYDANTSTPELSQPQNAAFLSHISQTRIGDDFIDDTVEETQNDKELEGQHVCARLKEIRAEVEHRKKIDSNTPLPRRDIDPAKKIANLLPRLEVIVSKMKNSEKIRKLYQETAYLMPKED